MPISPSLRRFLPALPALLAAPLMLSFSACETDLDPNDSYRETTLVYAVLDPGQPRQYARINKAFLNTNTNALSIAAGQPDSIAYADGVIDAKLQFLRRDSSVQAEFPLTRTANPNVEPGIFSQSGQVVYQTADDFPGLSSDTAISYRVVARNTRTGNVAQGTTDLPVTFQQRNFQRLIITQAGQRNYSISMPATQNDTTPVFNPGSNLRLTFTTQKRAVVYSAAIDFTFDEIVNGDTTRRTLTWELLNNARIESASSENYSVFYPEEGAFFESFLIRALDVSNDPPGMRRVPAPNALTYRVAAGSPQWARYLEVMNSASAITQTTPEFTNVRGGRGLVAGRIQHRVRQQISGSTARAAFNRYPNLKFVF